MSGSSDYGCFESYCYKGAKRAAAGWNDDSMTADRSVGPPLLTGADRIHPAKMIRVCVVGF